MIEFFSLLIAHILADFYWQPSRWVQSKKAHTWKSPAFYAHIAVVTLTSYLFLGYWDRPGIALFIGLTHAIIDLLKSGFDKKNTTTWFVADQALHVVMIAVAAGIATGKTALLLPTLTTFLQQPRTAGIITGTLLCLTPVAFFVGMFTKPWRDELEKLAPGVDDNLANAGRWIGMAERLLIYTFVLLDQFSAIGFLIAAKSLLRYNDKHPAGIPPAYISKKSEYVLIGTLLSYTCSIAIALATKNWIKFF